MVEGQVLVEEGVVLSEAVLQRWIVRLQSSNKGERVSK